MSMPRPRSFKKSRMCWTISSIATEIQKQNRKKRSFFTETFFTHNGWNDQSGSNQIEFGKDTNWMWGEAEEQQKQLETTTFISRHFDPDCYIACAGAGAIRLRQMGNTWRCQSNPYKDYVKSTSRCVVHDRMVSDSLRNCLVVHFDCGVEATRYNQPVEFRQLLKSATPSSIQNMAFFAIYLLQEYGIAFELGWAVFVSKFSVVLFLWKTCPLSLFPSELSLSLSVSVMVFKHNNLPIKIFVQFCSIPVGRTPIN